MPIKALLRLARAIAVVTAILAASGLPEGTLLAAAGNIVLDLAAVRSETEKLREHRWDCAADCRSD
jgi:hypothetical protein